MMHVIHAILFKTSVCHLSYCNAASLTVFFLQTLHNHNRDMDGGWSFEFRPYWRENLTTDLIFNPKARGIYEVEDMLCKLPMYRTWQCNTGHKSKY